MKVLTFAVLTAGIFALTACEQDNETPGNSNYDLKYSDSVFYLKAADYTVAPVISGDGIYSSFPEDLNINPTTGVITISPNGKNGQSQMGLRYRINYTGKDGSKDSTFIVLSGIHFQDEIYKMTSAGSTIKPIYNADINKQIPTGTYTADRDKLAINSVTGIIDFKQSIQNGLFGGDPDNDDWREIEIEYKPNDGSGRKTKFDLIIYYYDTESDIPSNVSTVMRAHQDLLLGIPKANIPVTNAPPDLAINDLVSVSKPRPPCIIIVGH